MVETRINEPDWNNHPNQQKKEHAIEHNHNIVFNQTEMLTTDKHYHTHKIRDFFIFFY